MSQLEKIQKDFLNYLLSQSNQIFSSIISTEKVSSEERLDIYGNAYRLRLLEALSEHYPVLQHYLGDDKFYELGDAYLEQYPSTFFSIRWFGDHLSEFLKEAFLSELAKFEWSLTEVFDAPDATPLTLEYFASIPPEDWANLQFKFHPSMRRLDFSYNVVGMWQAFQDQKNLPKPRKSKTPVHWLLWRNDYTNHFCSLTSIEAWALDSAHAGASFGALCEGLAERVGKDTAPQQAASFLKSWVSSGLLVK